MNRKAKIIQMRRFLMKHGNICCECKRAPDKFFPPYRKGSYFISFQLWNSSCYLFDDVDKYTTYKELVKSVKKDIGGK